MVKTVHLISAGLATSIQSSRYSTIVQIEKKHPLSVVNIHDMGLYVTTSYNELYESNYFYDKVFWLKIMFFIWLLLWLDLRKKFLLKHAVPLHLYLRKM